MEKNVFDKIKENPARTASQLIYTVLLVIVTVLQFLTGVGKFILNIIYIMVLIIIAIKNFAAFAVMWWIYLMALIIGLAAINLLSFVLCTAFSALQNNLLVKAFGYPADENEGGAVPTFCAKPFDPKEKALNELETLFARNAITEEEYLKRKKEIDGGNI